MSDIKSWSNSAGGNTSASPNGWPEGMAPSSVNDCAREMMASIRRQHESAEWIDLGNTPTFLTTASFSLVGDQRTAYHIGRRIKASDASTLYGTISDVTYSSNTRVNVTLDSGEFAASLSAVAVGILSFTNQSIPGVSATASYARSAGYATTAVHSNGTGTIPYADETGLRIIRGRVTGGGAVVEGSGFTVSQSSNVTTINFTTPFSANPTVTANAWGSDPSLFLSIRGTTLSGSACELVGYNSSGTGVATACTFIAIGPK